MVTLPELRFDRRTLTVFVTELEQFLLFGFGLAGSAPIEIVTVGDVHESPEHSFNHIGQSLCRFVFNFGKVVAELLRWII